MTELRARIKEALKHTRNLHFQASPRNSSSPARMSIVSINEDTGVTIKGAFMADLKDVASVLCGPSKFGGPIFDGPMTCRLEKTFGKHMAKVMKFDQAGRVMYEGEAFT